MAKTNIWSENKMMNKDYKRKELVSNNDPNVYELESAAFKVMVHNYHDQQAGVVRIVRSSVDSEEEFHMIQEQHNANHALYYFSIISDAAVSGRSSGNDCEKIR
ncbi:MAG: hypothetical protein Q8Q33_06530 [Chlamydiota bacterium]|nr:hypothetical protein [Chlamydiota bacterium]